MPFSSFYEAGIEVKPLVGNFFSIFSGIKQAQDSKEATDRGHDNLSD
jgi:hypothetical protein